MVRSGWDDNIATRTANPNHLWASSWPQSVHSARKNRSGAQPTMLPHAGQTRSYRHSIFDHHQRHKRFCTLQDWCLDPGSHTRLVLRKIRVARRGPSAAGSYSPALSMQWTELSEMECDHTSVEATKCGVHDRQSANSKCKMQGAK